MVRQPPQRPDAQGLPPRRGRVLGVHRATPSNRNTSGHPRARDCLARAARALLEAPSAETLKGKRDRAILATLLYHGLRREELCRLRVRDIQSREGVVHFRVLGKREKIRFIPVNPKAQRLIEDYLAMAGHREALNGALFRPVKNNRTGSLERALDANSVYRNIVRHYGRKTGLAVEVNGLCVHSLRRRRRRTRCSTTPTSRKCRNGWDTRMCPRPGSMIAGQRDRRIARRSG